MKSLLEQLPSIVADGKREAERVKDRLRLTKSDLSSKADALRELMELAYKRRAGG